MTEFSIQLTVTLESKAWFLRGVTWLKLNPWKSTTDQHKVFTVLKGRISESSVILIRLHTLIFFGNYKLPFCK